MTDGMLAQKAGSGFIVISTLDNMSTAPGRRNWCFEVEHIFGSAKPF